MRKIELTDYSCDLRDENGDVSSVPYHVKDSLVELIMARDLQLNGAGLLEANKLATKLLEAKDGSILLEEQEWGRLINAVNTVKGLGRTDVELVNRIINAPSVDVEEKKPDTEAKK